MPKISVIIPGYNSETTIRDTIKSVQQQTFSDFELIVINDGSTDKTAAIVQSILDPRIKLFSYKNGGLPVARNRGIARAKGKFIAFLDADDLWIADKLESQLQALENCPKAAVAYSLTDYINEAGQVIKKGKHKIVDGNVLEELLIDNFIESGSNPLIRKQALEKVGGFDASINTAADWEMWLRLAEQFDFVAVPAVQVLYRISETSMSTNIRNQEIQCLEVINRVFSRISPSLRPLKQKSLVNL